MHGLLQLISRHSFQDQTHGFRLLSVDQVATEKNPLRSLRPDSVSPHCCRGATQNPAWSVSNASFLCHYQDIAGKGNVTPSCYGGPMHLRNCRFRTVEKLRIAFRIFFHHLVVLEWIIALAETLTSFRYTSFCIFCTALQVISSTKSRPLPLTTMQWILASAFASLTAARSSLGRFVSMALNCVGLFKVIVATFLSAEVLYKIDLKEFCAMFSVESVIETEREEPTLCDM
jgi:hypothetical protein